MSQGILTMEAFIEALGKCAENRLAGESGLLDHLLCTYPHTLEYVEYAFKHKEFPEMTRN